MVIKTSLFVQHDHYDKNKVLNVLIRKNSFLGSTYNNYNIVTKMLMLIQEHLHFTFGQRDGDWAWSQNQS